MVYPNRLSTLIGDVSNLSGFNQENAKEDRLDVHVSGIRILGGDVAEMTAQAILDAVKAVSYTHLTLPTIYSV